MTFSVLMGTYKNDDPEYLIQAIDSIIKQTAQPNEIFIVKDGPLTRELDDILEDYSQQFPELFTFFPLKENRGLGNALKIGIENCRNELIARMDSDDIAKPNRFELQLNLFKTNSALDAVGGHIEEFDRIQGDLNRIRKVKLNHNAILCHSKYRSPINHVTVMYKRKAVIKAGNYIKRFCGEDYDLWLRMLINGCIFENVDQVLVDVRVGNGMIERRRGIKMFICEREYLRFAYKKKHFTKYEYYRNIFIRLVFRSMPPRLIKLFYSIVRYKG